MDTNYTPKVGDSVRRASWMPSMHSVDVTAIGRYRFLGVDSDGEFPHDLNGKWIKVETPLPLPEQWSNVYPDGFWQSHTTAVSAGVNSHDGRIAVLHIWTDADGVDHAEILRIKQ